MLLWQKRYTVFEDPWIPDTEIAKFLNHLRKGNIPCYGHIGINLFHPAFKENSRSIEETKSIVKSLCGRFGNEYGFGAIKKEYISPELVKRIHALKAYYDPKNIMNRGKLV